MPKKYVHKVSQTKGVIPPGHGGTVNRTLIDRTTSDSKSFELVHGTINVEGGSDYHSHEVESAFYILKGEMIATVNGKRFRVGPGTAVFTPKGEKHKLKALTRSEILVIYAPPRRSN